MLGTTKVAVVAFLLAAPYVECKRHLVATASQYDAAPAAEADAAPEGAVLVPLAANTSQTLAGWDWPTSEPCAAGVSGWTGVECQGDLVTSINLPGLGLGGPLPEGLLGGASTVLPALASLNLSRNHFTGALPASWASASLASMDLSNNALTGALPREWGASGAFPALASLDLSNNALAGALPQPEWTAGGLPVGAVVTLRPGNDGMCGVLPPLAADLQLGAPPGAAVPPLRPASSTYINATASTTYFQYKDLFAATPGGAGAASVTFVNTLGSCVVPCGRTAPIETNLFDLAWQNNVTVAALIAANPGLPFNGGDQGIVLSIPCYAPGTVPVCFGSDAAAWQFAGGNQAGPAGAWGAAVAGKVVAGGAKPRIGDGGAAGSGTGYYSGYYSGSLQAVGGEAMTQPVFWFVDLGAQLTVTGVTVRAGEAMTNVSVLVCEDTSDALADQRPISGLAFAAGESKVVPIDHPAGRYLFLFSDGAPLSLAAVQVWVQVGDAAYLKAVATSSAASIAINTTVVGIGGERIELCDIVSAGDDGRVWASVDLGYYGQVQNVIVHVQGVSPGVTAELFVSDTPGAAGATPDALCGPAVLLPKLGFLGVSCNRTGRYVTLEIHGQRTIQLCDMEVYLKEKPTPADDDNASSAGVSVVAIAVGCVVGGVVLLGCVVLAVMYLRWRRQHLRVEQALAEKGGKGELTGSGGSGSGDSLGPSTTTDGRLTGSGSGPRNSGSRGSGGPPRSAGSAGSGELARMGTFMGALLRGEAAKDLAKASSASLATDLTRFGPEWNITDFSQLELLKPIGEGSFGLVHMARFFQTTVAVKMLTMDARRGGAAGTDSRPALPSPAVMDALEREASIMASLRHPNVVQYIGACLDPPCLIMEHCPRKSLDCLLASAAANPAGPAAKNLSWTRLVSMALDGAKGMLYLHSRSPPIIHRDLKSPNLLVDAQWHVKVSDFNLSRAIEPGSIVSSFQTNNPRWLAPEVLRGAQATTASDVFSFGVVLWELMAWELPWEAINNSFQIIAAVTEGQRPAVPPASALPAGPLLCYDEYVGLMRDCWRRDPQARPSVDEVATRLRAMLVQLVHPAGAGAPQPAPVAPAPAAGDQNV